MEPILVEGYPRESWRLYKRLSEEATAGNHIGVSIESDSLILFPYILYSLPTAVRGVPPL